jgi:hypothetical protein
VARWCVGSRVETTGGVFQVREGRARAAGWGGAASDAVNSKPRSAPIVAPGDQRPFAETRDLSQRVAEFALSKPRRSQERKCQPYSCPKDE